MAIGRPDDLGEIANLGLTLAEAKLLLVQVRQEVVAAQAHHQAMFRPDCHMTPDSPQPQPSAHQAGKPHPGLTE
jgi:hypothetical protein